MNAGLVSRFFRNLFHRMLDKDDQARGVPSAHMHFVIDTSLGAFVDFLFFIRMATHRQALPKDAAHLARILTTQYVDCGTCVQSSVNMALKEGVRPEWIRAALDHRLEALPPELAEVCEFTGHILRHTYEEDALRESIRARHGDAAVVDLAYAIATAQVFPLVKQALGFAKSCSRVVVSLTGDARSERSPGLPAVA